MISPLGKKRFRPGILLSFFTLVFLPTFIGLGFWQLNRAVEKDQLMVTIESKPLLSSEINWQAAPLYRSVLLSGEVLSDAVFLLDNKTLNGQFGYEVFSLFRSPNGVVAISLGWVAGSADRQQLPHLTLPTSLMEQPFTIRSAPQNPLFDTDANVKHASAENVWVVQSLSSSWLTDITGEQVLAFLQLDSAKDQGVGPVIWEPTVMSATAHRGYAFQWFSMAIALLAMFVYAGFKPTDLEKI